MEISRRLDLSCSLGPETVKVTGLFPQAQLSRVVFELNIEAMEDRRIRRIRCVFFVFLLFFFLLGEASQ